MEPTETIHLSAKDLVCPICYQRYGLDTFQPMSLSCGHNLCSQCLRRVRNCPLCRGRIHDRSSYSKNVLITCILEQKEKVKECKAHSRPLEFFCKDHKQLLCVDCGIEGNHFSHNFVRCKEVDTRAERLRGFIQKIDTKEEDSRNKYKTFLEKEKRNLKRKVDDILDEYIEPIMAVKKKLRREIDAFILAQSSMYDKEANRDAMLKWKKESESLVAKWEAGGEGEVAALIVGNETDEIEKKIAKYENRIEKVEGETGNKMNFLLKDMKSRMSLIRAPFKKLKGRLNQVISMNPSEVDPRLEREYLAEFLQGHGVSAVWVQKEGAEILEIKNGREVAFKEIEDKYFDCTLEKLHVHSFKVEGKQFEVVCTALERIISLLDLKLFLQNISDQEISILGDSVQKVKSIERLNVVLISERVSEQAFKNFWASISRLPKLKALDLTLEDCDEVATSQSTEVIMPYGKMKSLKELSIRLSDCDAVSNESFGEFLLNLKGLTHLTKLSLMLTQCKKISYKLFDSLCKTLSAFARLEELSLIFEEIFEASNPGSILTLSTVISSLTKLKKLEISFADNVPLPAGIVKKFFSKISISLPGLHELTIDLSRCRDVGNPTLESLGESVSQISQLKKFALRAQMCGFTEKGVAAFTGHVVKLENLRSLSLDFRHCKLLDENNKYKALEHLSKLTKLVEKDYQFDETKHDQQQQMTDSEVDSYNGGHRFRSWSAAEGSVSFDESEILEIDEYEEDFDDYEEDDEDDDEMGEEFEDEFELVSMHTSGTGTSADND